MVHDMRGRILAHRGLWSQKSDQNSLDALAAAITEGFGFETDLRDFSGEIVVSHDIPNHSAPQLSDLLKSIDSHSPSSSQMLAWNIKADGLLNKLVAAQLPGDSFYFDMSFPQELLFLKANLPIAKRLSEFEKQNARAEHRHFWLDAFEDDWYLEELELILPLIKKSRVTLVSSELHGRDMSKCWDFFKKFATDEHNLSICTDHPRELLGYL